jgi:hypothetical protein
MPLWHHWAILFGDFSKIQLFYLKMYRYLGVGGIEGDTIAHIDTNLVS